LSLKAIFNFTPIEQCTAFAILCQVTCDNLALNGSPQQKAFLRGDALADNVFSDLLYVIAKQHS